MVYKHADKEDRIYFYDKSKMWNSLNDNFKDFNVLNDFKEAVFKNEIADIITVRDCF